MAVELASAYISIIPDTSKIAPALKKSFSGIDAEGKAAGKKLADGLNNSLDSGLKGKGKSAGAELANELESAMQSGVKGAGKKVSSSVSSELGDLDSVATKAGSGFSNRLKESMSFGAVAGGVAALTSSVVGSMGDLVGAAAEASDATDKFKATLDFAGLDTSTIEATTKRAQDYADKTVYNLGDIQNMTAQLASNGIKDYSGLAEAAGNLNAIAGGNAETFKSVGMVMTQTAGAGKLTTENWNQLSDAIPGASGKIQQALLDAGAYTGNFRDAMAEGEITAEEFNDAVMKLGNEPVAVEAAQSTKTFEGMLGNLQATIEGQLANAFTQLKPIIGAAMDGIAKAAEVALPLFVDGVKLAVDGLKFLGDHKGPVLGVVGALGSLTAGMVAYNAVMKIQAMGGFVGMLTKMGAAMKGTAVAQTLLNTAMWTSPITWIVAGIAAVVAGLVLFFTKTETGRKIWASFTEALGKGWDWVVEKFKAGIEWVKTNFGPTFEAIKEKAIGIWDGVTEKVSAVFGKIKEIVSGALDFWKTGDTTDYAAALGMNPDSPIFTFLQGFRDKLIEVKDFAVDAWGLMQEKWAEFTTGFGQFYQTWIQPVIDAFGTAFSVIAPVVSAAWDVLGSAVSTVWNNIIKPVFDAFMQVASVVFPAIAGVVETVVGLAFRNMGDVISNVWNGVIKPAWDVMHTVFGIVADILTGNFSNLGNRFSELGQRIMALVGGVFNAAFNILRSVVTNSLNAAKAVIGIFKQAVVNMVNISKEKINSLVAGFQAMPGKIRAAFAGAGSWLMDAGRSIIRGLADGVRAAAGMVENAVRAVIPDNIERFVPGLHLGGVVPAFARGGVLPDVPGVPRSERDPILGWSTERKTPIARVEPGEFIVNRDATRKFLPLLAAINGGKLTGKMGDMGLPGYAEGGVVSAKQMIDFALGKAVNGHQASRPLQGAPYVFGGSNWGDCTGTTSAFAALAIGMNPFPRKYFTGDQGPWLSSHRYIRGVGPKKDSYAVSFYNGGPGGGHSAASIYDSNGKETKIEMGGSPSMGHFNTGVGATHSMFTDRFHIPLKSSIAQAVSEGKVTGTSTEGMTVETSAGQKQEVSWGTAQGLFDLAKRGIRLFDTGGLLRSGQLAFNAGPNEHVMSPYQWDKLVAGLTELADAVKKGNLSYDWIKQRYGTRASTLSMEATGGALGGWEAETTLLKDAEKALAEVRKKATSENEDVVKAEEKLAKAKKTAEVDLKLAREKNGSDEKKMKSAQESAAKKVRKAELELEEARKNATNSTGEYAEELKAANIAVEQARKASISKGFNQGANLKAFLNDGTLSDYASTASSAGGFLKEFGVVGSDVGGVVSGLAGSMSDALGATSGLKKAYQEQAEANSALVGAEAELKAARASGDGARVAEAEERLSDAREAAASVAAATGHVEIATALKVAGAVVDAVKLVVEFVDGKVQSVLQAHVAAFKAVSGAMEAVGKLNDEVGKLRENVAGLVLDQAMAQIELAAAARNVRIAQMDGVTAQLEATKTLAEAQAAFDEQRKADMRLAAMGYDDLSLAYDRFRWGMLDANGDVMDQMAAWSDESHALYSELLAAQVNQQLVEKQAQQANLEAAYKHTLAVISLNDVTANLEIAAKKLAVASGHAFGMDQVGATVGQRYAELMGEKASLQADQASLKTWLNPVNWFTTMPANQRRIKQIDQQLAQLKAMPEFKNVDQSALAEMDKVIKASGWMGFFGAGDKVDEMIKNSALGDAARALDQMEFENRLIDLKADQAELRRKVEKNLAEVEYRKKLDPLETLIAGLEQERDSNKTWAEYWRTDNENIRKALADLAGFQADSAAELKQMAAEPNKVVQISGDTFSREQLEAAMAELGVRVERLERPRASASQVVASRR